MQWLSGLPFGENPVVQIGLLVASGIAALAVLAIIYRFVFAHRLRVPGGRTRQPRLGLVDAFSLDGQRQLVLVRRDNVEHLVMIGGPNDVLVESQINRALAPVRENQNVLPATPPRRAESAVVAPTVPVAPAAKVLPPQAAPAEVRQIRPQTVSAAPAGPTVEAPPLPASSPPAAPTIAPPPAPAAARVEPAVAKVVVEPQRAVSGGRPQSKTVPPRSAMPPPITPTGAAGYRGNVTRLTEKQPQASPSGLPVAAAQPAAAGAPGSAPHVAAAAPPPLASAGPAPLAPRPAPAHPPQSARMPAAPATVPAAAPVFAGAPVSTAQPVAASPPPPARMPTAPAAPNPGGADPPAPALSPEPGVVAPVAVVKTSAPAAEAPIIVKAELHPAAARAASAGPQPPTPDRAPPASTVDRAPAASPKVEDPFAGLDSLEAEMARLLGREK